jgi:thiosulfate/3-mercaptopyruvate sulfurtransferase
LNVSAPAELLIAPERLERLLASGSCVAVDCRYDLGKPGAGRQSFLVGHIPGAHYVDLGSDLSSPVTSTSGRHPLPSPAAFAEFLSRIAWTREVLLVAYDERNNAIAARLWWLMRYFGCDAVLLDGGLEAWTRAGLMLESGSTRCVPSAVPRLQPDASLTATAADIVSSLARTSLTLMDARAPERFSGDVEPLDALGGHIPGALNRPLGLNLDSSGCFKTPADLKQEFAALLNHRSPASVVHSCGSGVTACHNRFAMELAGLGDTKVYPGSWSEWIRDPSRPIETGR